MIDAGPSRGSAEFVDAEDGHRVDGRPGFPVIELDVHLGPRVQGHSATSQLPSCSRGAVRSVRSCSTTMKGMRVAALGATISPDRFQFHAEAVEGVFADETRRFTRSSTAPASS